MGIAQAGNRTFRLFLSQVGPFLVFMARRVYRDHCAQTAASLTYTSLLALVPFMAVGYSIVRGFGLFPDLLNEFQNTLMQIFTPDVGSEVKQYIQGLVNHGAHLPVVSMMALFVTAVMLLYTINDALNRIWRVDYKRRTLLSFAIYIVVVISGPLLLGSSLAITTYLISYAVLPGDASGMSWLRGIPWLVTFIAFSALYRWVPNTHVAWRYALTGGLVAMLLFELAKWGFALYIKWVPTYGLLYGALAGIPLTLVWIYLSWLVVLIGAETARCLAIYIHNYKQPPITARTLLGFFFMGRDEGVFAEQAAAWAYLGRDRVRRTLDAMQRVGLVWQRADGCYVLSDRAKAMSLSALSLELAKHLKHIEN